MGGWFDLIVHLLSPAWARGDRSSQFGILIVYLLSPARVGGDRNSQPDNSMFSLAGRL